ncbi:MAG: glycoside hydrolase family 32 protein [Bacillaceae bacterium]|nr:glycoside hydrolase family 32 protein [Bacillaceae bacterium]
MNKHQLEIQKAQQYIEQYAEQVKQSKWYLQYHIAPPAFWMNDPNGLSFFRDEYHVFYQHHPFSPEWGPMYWGHVKSKDLVHWEHLPIALAPESPYDRDGCFSGSAIEKDGKLYVMYTGNRWTGADQDRDLKQVQCLAVSEDGVQFEKAIENPVLSNPPEGNIHPLHFRDPKVWKHGEFYYSIIGSRTMDHRGQALCYQSKDLVRWEFLDVAAKSDGSLGYMWECPNLFHLDGRDVLMFSPQGMNPEGNLNQNDHQSGYVMGNFDYKKGLLDHGNFYLLDYGFDFYAPQVMKTPDGRTVLMAWMAMWESDMPEKEDQWAGAMTIPRELKVKDGKILSSPLAELKQLRHDPVAYQNEWVKGTCTFPGVEGDCLELEILVDVKQARTFDIVFRMGDEEQTVLRFDRRGKVITLDRNRSGKGEGGQRQVPIELNQNRLYLQVLLDKSSVEIFVNGGEQVMTARIYPDESSKGIQFYSDREVELITLKKWALKPSISFEGILRKGGICSRG